MVLCKGFGEHSYNEILIGRIFSNCNGESALIVAHLIQIKVKFLLFYFRALVIARRVRRTSIDSFLPVQCFEDRVIISGTLMTRQD